MNPQRRLEVILALKVSIVWSVLRGALIPVSIRLIKEPFPVMARVFHESVIARLRVETDTLVCGAGMMGDPIGEISVSK